MKCNQNEDRNRCNKTVNRGRMIQKQSEWYVSSVQRCSCLHGILSACENFHRWFIEKLPIRQKHKKTVSRNKKLFCTQLRNHATQYLCFVTYLCFMKSSCFVLVSQIVSSRLYMKTQANLMQNEAVQVNQLSWNLVCRVRRDRITTSHNFEKIPLVALIFKA